MTAAPGKVFVLGLDSVPPLLAFDRFRDIMPNLSRIMDGGMYGPLRSTVPAITCPAWMSMLTGKNPGRLGFYGFRNRKNYSYDQMTIANSTAVHEPTVWDILSAAGKHVVLLGIPQTYPPKPVNGEMVTCFLTPSIESDYTWPKALKEEIKGVVGEYILDVRDFRTDDKQRLLRQIYEMTDKRFALLEHLLKTRPWDFAMMVEMGPDRLHHGFWKYFDPAHRAHVPGSPLADAIPGYYRHLDGLIGRILPLVEGAHLLVVSDHGSKGMTGGVCLNEWLIEKGYLVLKEYPDRATPLEKNLHLVDWTKTRAWGAGGYYGRLSFNVAGREPHGVIPPGEFDAFRDKVVSELEAMVDHEGKPLGNKAFRPADVYTEVRNIPPDLIVYFGDLDWRSVGSVGMRTLYTFENDTGPDDANHEQHGIFIMKAHGMEPRGRVEGLDIRDVASTILALEGVPVPADMEGRSLA
jgi:predicted AlkP superfamily phosphohydrolase/phosphomutase